MLKDVAHAVVYSGKADVQVILARSRTSSPPDRRECYALARTYLFEARRALERAEEEVLQRERAIARGL